MLSLAATRESEPNPAQATPWQAHLELGFGARAGRCQLLLNRHSGPLRLQRLLYPQGALAAEALLLHPPGGIAGGDQLHIELDVGEGAQVLATTPGAAKWYRSDGRVASQKVTLRVHAGAALEWLPQESILFDGSDTQQTLTTDLTDDARMIGWDIVQLGRTAAGERWSAGRWRQRLSLRRNGRQLWCERADLAADSALREAAQGLAGLPVFGTLWATAPVLDDPALLDALRDTLASSVEQCAQAGSMHAAATWLPQPRSVLLVRALASDAERLRCVLEAAWMQLRPQVIGLEAQRPRIWST